MPETELVRPSVKALLAYSFICFGFMAACVSAHDIITTKLTYTRDISRIFARRCVSCHSRGSSIPLTNYGEVRPWAIDIKGQVLGRSMPPWGAVKGFGDISPDHALTEEEVMIIAAWVVGGAPDGNSALLPKGGATSTQMAASESPVADAFIVNTRAKVTHPLRLAGVRPITDSIVPSARIVAIFPNGRTEPLLWLLQYDGRSQRIFRLRRTLLLPTGTEVAADTPVRFALECGR